MDGNRGAKGSIKDRIISMLYRLRYRKKKQKEEDNFKNLKIFRRLKNNGVLYRKYNHLLNNSKVKTNIQTKQKVFIRVKKKVGIPKPENIPNQNKKIIDNRSIVVNNLNKKDSISLKPRNLDNVKKGKALNIHKIKPGYDSSKINKIESKTVKLAESINLKKEEYKAKSENIVLKETNKFIKESLENINKIKNDISEIKIEVKIKNKGINESEEKYKKLKEDIDKLKIQYSNVRNKYDLSEFSILESIKLIDNIEYSKSLSSLNELEMMINVCKKELEKINGVIIINKNQDKVGISDNQSQIKIKFKKDKEILNKTESIENMVAYELKNQQKIIDDMNKQASYFEKQISKKTEYISHAKILSSLLRIAGGIITIPFTGKSLFGIALGTTMINKGLKELNKSFETREKIVINYKYEDISNKIANVKDKVEYTNLVLSDSLSEIKKLKENFNSMFNEYNKILPEYADMLEKINDLEKKLLISQAKLNNMNKKLDKEKEMNKQKLKKINN